MFNATNSRTVRSFALLAMSAALALGGNSALAAGATAGSTISNVGVFDYQDDSGSDRLQSSNAVNATVQQVYAVNITPNGTVASPGQVAYAIPGQKAVLTYDVTNTGNGGDTITLSTQDGNGAAVSGVSYYLDNGDGIYGAGDTLISGQIVLSADQTAHFYAVYTIPASTPGSVNITLTPVGTSVGDATQKDSDNVGLITSRNVYAATLSADRALNITTPGSVSTSHTLKNTGNDDLDPSRIIATTTVSDGSGVLSGVTFQITQPNGTLGPVSTTLQGAFAGLAPLAPGSSYLITVVYSSNAGLAINTTASDRLNVSYNQASDSANSNTVGNLSNTDSLTVIMGVATITKVMDNCGADVSCLNPTLNASTVKPGDYLRYTVTVKNDGTSALKFPSLKDYVPAQTTFVRVSGSRSGANGTVLFGSSRASWNAAAPTALATSTSATSGPFVYVGLDNSAANTQDGTVNASDVLQPGESLSLVLEVNVNKTTPTP